MKKAAAFLMVIAMVMITAGAMASGYWYDGRGWWYYDNYGNWEKLYQSTPMEWKTYLVDHNWYYVTCEDGTAGFLFASRVRLIPV